MRTTRLISLVIALLVTAAACGDEQVGSGTYEVRIYGESFVEDHIPADETDGWRIEFDRFLVVVSHISASGPAGDFAMSDALVFDLARDSAGVGHLVASMELDEGRIDTLSYRVGPAAEAAAGNVETSDVDFMVSNAYALYVTGTATKSGRADITFAWGFDTDTAYVGCHTTASIPDGGTGASVITIHADHLFYDDLESEEPNVAFDLIASADDGDGDVAVEELQALDITAQSRYQVGSRDIADLWAFIEAQSRTVGHIDGEGHCDTH